MSWHVNGATFDKFGWLKVLQSDDKLSGTAFRIGVVIATTFTRTDGTGWVFELARLPDVGGRSMDRHTRDIAIRLLVERGHVSQTYRSAGGRGITARGSFDLLKPGSETCQVLAENLADYTPKPGGFRHKTWQISHTKNRVNQRKHPPSGTSSGTSSGGRSPQPGTSPDEPQPFKDLLPQNLNNEKRQEKNNRTAVPDTANAAPDNSFEEPRCERHRNHMRYPIPPNCRDCRDVRLQHELEAEMDAAREQAERAAAAQARRGAIGACDHCDDHGWLLDADGAVADPAVKCTQHKAAG